MQFFREGTLPPLPVGKEVNYQFFNFVLSILIYYPFLPPISKNTKIGQKITSTSPTQLYLYNSLYLSSTVIFPCSAFPKTQSEQDNHMSAITQTPQFSFFVARLVGLLLRVLWLKYKIFIWKNSDRIF